jgi:hypothetical protein
MFCFSSGFTGGYSYSSPSDFAFMKTLKGFNLNNRGCNPRTMKKNEVAALKGLNDFVYNLNLY